LVLEVSPFVSGYIAESQPKFKRLEKPDVGWICLVFLFTLP